LAATRSAAISIAVGVAYLLIVENLLGPVWDSAGEWLPADVFSAITTGGTGSISFEKSVLIAVGYGILGLVVMCFVFTRRDVTD